MAESTHVLRHTEIDGVPCFWVDTRRPTLAAVLTFRFGMADEPLPESGWQHLLEHLALHGRDDGPLAVNGQVGLLTTALHLHGPPEHVASGLGEISRWLSEPSFAELDRERQVLRAEAAIRGHGPAVRAMGWRYGAQGPGVPGFGEPGLGRATPERLFERAHRTFSSGNAVLALDGPPPGELSLPLPVGPRLPWSPAVPCDDVLPAAYADESGVTVSGVVSRTPAMLIAVDLLREALADQFRNQDGSAYAPWSSYEPVDAGHAVILGGSDVQPQALDRVADSVLLMTRRLRTYRPDDDRLARAIAQRVQAMVDPYAGFSVALRAAAEALMDRPPPSLEEMVDHAKSVSASQIVDGFVAFHRSLLLGLPGDATWVGQLPRLVQATHAPRAQGERWRSVDWPADKTRLVLGADEAELRVGDNARRMPLDSVVGMLSFDNGVRHLIGLDGYGITVDPRRWRRGDAVAATLDRAVPPHLHLPMLAPPGEPAPVRLSAARRWSHPIVRGLRSIMPRNRTAWVALTAILVIAALIVAGLAEGSYGIGPLVILTVFLVRRLASIDRQPPDCP